MEVAPGHSLKHTQRWMKKHGEIYVQSKNPWAHLHPRHLVKDYHYEA